MGNRRPWRPAAAVAAAVSLSACSMTGGDPADEAASDGSGASSSAAAKKAVDVVADGLAAPWSIAFHEGAPLVSERDSGRILELDVDGGSHEVGTITGVTASGEGGLLGIAVRDDHLYAYFTAGPENRIERFPLTGSPGALALGEPEVLLDGIPAASFHNGGRLAFGPDEMLYATVGDAGDSEQAQDPASLSGTILRMTPGGDVPDDNPFADSLVFSYGHRNPQGLAWDADGTMYASEFGQDTWDELNVIEAGNNYGWPDVEGIAHQDDFTDPVQQWAPSDASPSGIAIAGDTLYMGALRGERLIEVPLADPTSSIDNLVGEYGRLRDVTVTPEGDLWVLTNNTDGRGDPRADDDRILAVDLE